MVGRLTAKDRLPASLISAPNTYRPLRIDEAPVVETHLVKSSEAPGGFGEAPTAVVAPAVTNAIFAATAKRIRTLPIDTNLLKFPS